MSDQSNSSDNSTDGMYNSDLRQYLILFYDIIKLLQLLFSYIDKIRDSVNNLLTACPKTFKMSIRQFTKRNIINVYIEQHSSRKHKRTKTQNKLVHPSDIDFEVSESKESDSEDGDDVQEYRSNELSFKENKGNYSLTINAGRKDFNQNKDGKKISSLLMALTRTKAMSLLNLNAASKNKNEQEEVEFSETTGLTAEQLKMLKSTRCLFRYNAGWRIYWDLFMILLALYN